MVELKVIDGRLSDRYNHFEEYRIESCKATATRLMGAVAIRLSWVSPERIHARYYQVIHLDFSEYGIDEYQEYECIPGDPSYRDEKYAMNNLWNRFVNVMGGEVVNLSVPVMLRLIDMAIPLASDGIDREYDDEENRIFRKNALQRLNLMREALAAQGFEPDNSSSSDIIAKVSPRRLGAYETINYFLMRLVDLDYDAASYLSSMSVNQLREIPLTEQGIQSLMRSDIKKSSIEKDPPSDGTSQPFRCRITTLARDAYYHSSFVIFLDKDKNTQNRKVSEFRLGSLVKMSEFETAVQISRKEYITVFDCPDDVLKGFNSRYIDLIGDTDPSQVPNGWLYTVYNKNNSHVNKSSYRLGDDVYGYALLSIGGELALMSNKLVNINLLEDSVAYSMYAPLLKLKGRYLLETPVFHTLCHAGGAYFDDLIDTKGND